MGSEVRWEKTGAAAVVTIDNPPVNALHPAVGRQLSLALAEIRGETGVRSVVLTGAGRCFVAGGDIGFLDTIDRHTAEPYVLAIQAMQDELRMMPQPVIAALHGPVLGGGCELALACDIRIADETATFGLPEVTLGLIPAAGGTQALPRLVPVGRAKRMLFTGERISAADALELTLIDELVPPGEAVAAALALADRIARCAPLAVAAAKRAVNLGLEMTLADGQRLEATLLAGLAETEDRVEGTQAFLAKRPPVFVGQ